jgi:hypothetical protein
VISQGKVRMSSVLENRNFLAGEETFFQGGKGASIKYVHGQKEGGGVKVLFGFVTNCDKRKSGVTNGGGSKFFSSL